MTRPPKESWDTVRKNFLLRLAENPPRNVDEVFEQELIDKFPPVDADRVDAYLMGMWDCHELYGDWYGDNYDDLTRIRKNVLDLLLVLYAADLSDNQ